MTIGVGVDIIEVQRVQDKLKQALFKERVFSVNEITYCEKFANKFEHFAGRFAAKEAFLKATGQGWKGGYSFCDIEIINDIDGKPTINLLAKAAENFKTLKIDRIHVSISHVKEMATAVVLLEGQS